MTQETFSVRSHHGSKSTVERAAEAIFTACGFFAVLAVASITLYMIFSGTPALFKVGILDILFGTLWQPAAATPSFGILYVILTSIVGTFLAILIGVPVGVMTAVFLAEVAPKKLANVVRPAVELLAGIPSVIYGLWGGLVLVPAIYPFWNWVAKYLGWIPLFAGPAANPSRTVATVAVVLAVMILPIITSMSRDIFLQTPRLQEEAALALGATKWEMVKLAVLPFGKSGVVSASMLGLGRALGETMAVLMILSPGLNYSIKLLQASQNQTIAANIAAQYPEANDLGVSVLIGTGLVLFLITFVVNFIARKLTENSGISATMNARAISTRIARSLRLRAAVKERVGLNLSKSMTGAPSIGEALLFTAVITHSLSR